MIRGLVWGIIKDFILEKFSNKISQKLEDKFLDHFTIYQEDNEVCYLKKNYQLFGIEWNEYYEENNNLWLTIGYLDAVNKVYQIFGEKEPTYLVKVVNDDKLEKLNRKGDDSKP